MCATLRTPSDYDEDPADQAIAPQMTVPPYEGIPIYEFEIPGVEYGPIDIRLSLVTLEDYCDPDDPEEVEDRCCRWLVESDFLNLEKYYPVRAYGGLNCSSKTFSLDIESSEGTIEIRPHLHGEVKVIQEEYGGCKEPFCGNCRCICGTLCVIEFINGVPQDPVLYEWNKESRIWGDEYDGFQLLKDQDTGGCLIAADGFSPVPITCPQVSAVVEDEYGNGYSFSCWECKCEGITVDCCPGNLPSVLNATFTQETGRDPSTYTPFSVALTYEGDGAWVGFGGYLSSLEGPAFPGGGTLRFRYRCDGVDSIAVDMDGVDLLGNIIPFNTSGGQEIPPAACDPVFANVGTIEDGNGIYHGVFDMVVTE